MKMFAKPVFTQQTSVLLLALTALLCLPAALRIAAPDAVLTLLVPVVVLGVLGGFLVDDPRLNGRRLGSIFMVAGAIVLFVRIGQIGPAIAASLQETGRVMLRMMLPWPGIGSNAQDLAAWLGAQGQVLRETIGFGQRTAAWLANIVRGDPGNDPAARALVLTLLLWLLVGWASWRIRAKNDPAGGLLPSSIFLALQLDLTAQNRWPLWVHLCAFLLLLAIANVSRLTGDWKRRRTDFSDSITEDSLVNAVLVIIMVMSAAYAASVFSVKDVLDKLREHEKPRTSSVTSSGSRHVTSGPDATLLGVHPITGGPSLSKDVVMYISTGDLPRMPSAVQLQAPYYYWRGATYQRYSGGGWSNSMVAELEVPASAQLVKGSPVGYRKVHATVSIPAGIRSGMYWTGVLVDADQPVLLVQRAGTDRKSDPDIIGAAIVGDAAASMQSYTFDSLLEQVDEAALRAAPATYPEWIRQQYLQLPDAVPERVRALARDITAQGQTPYDRALAIETYVRKFPYSLDVPAPPSQHDAADYFLFDLKRGYCDYYATAMAVLARAAGLPARLVVGYASGSYDQYSAEYVVTQADAHAWTEIYFPTIGWIEFEPTAGQPAPVREAIRASGQQASTEAQRVSTWKELPAVYAAASRFGWWLPACLLALILAWLVADQVRLHRMPPDAATLRAYQRIRLLTRRLGGTASIGQTAHEHAAAVLDGLAFMSGENRVLKALAARVSGGLVDVTDLYMRSLFAPLPLSHNEGRKAARLWLALAWRLVLLNVLVAIRPLSVPSRSAPSSPPGSPAE